MGACYSLPAGKGHLQRMNDTWNVTQNRQADVDEQVRIAATLQEDTERREDDGEDDFADIAESLAFVSMRSLVSFDPSRPGIWGAWSEQPRPGRMRTHLAVKAIATVLVWRDFAEVAKFEFST